MKKEPSTVCLIFTHAFSGHTAYGVFTELESLKRFQRSLQNFSVLFLLGGVVGRIEFTPENNLHPSENSTQEKMSFTDLKLVRRRSLQMCSCAALLWPEGAAPLRSATRDAFRSLSCHILIVYFNTGLLAVLEIVVGVHFFDFLFKKCACLLKVRGTHFSFEKEKKQVTI